MKTSSEMNYMSVNPLINIMDSPLPRLRAVTNSQSERQVGEMGIPGDFRPLRDIKEGRGREAELASETAAIHCSHGRHLARHLYFM